MIPSSFFLTKGVGVHKEKLNSFELALRDAGISQFNLVPVSSILPPDCKRISKEKGLSLLKPGQIVFCVLSHNETNEPNRLISASVGCAIVADKTQYGYLSEHHSFGESKEKAGKYAKDLAVSMLASLLGIKLNDKRRKIIHAFNFTQTARGDKNGLWTSVVAAVIFIP